MVDVGDAGGGLVPVGDLVRVAQRGDAAAEVEELVDAALSSAVAHHAGQAHPVVPRPGQDPVGPLDHQLGQVPTGR